jgi:hypothetical protein
MTGREFLHLPPPLSAGFDFFGSVLVPADMEKRFTGLHNSPGNVATDIQVDLGGSTVPAASSSQTMEIETPVPGPGVENAPE